MQRQLIIHHFKINRHSIDVNVHRINKYRLFTPFKPTFDDVHKCYYNNLHESITQNITSFTTLVTDHVSTKEV